MAVPLESTGQHAVAMKLRLSLQRLQRTRSTQCIILIRQHSQLAQPRRTVGRVLLRRVLFRTGEGG